MTSIWRSLGNALKQPKRPQFLIIGVQKAGTTTLYDLLNGYPQFCGSLDKETGYFSNDDYYHQGKSWYARQFKHCSRSAIGFEATPVYIYHPDAAQRIFAFNPNMKFIVILREPAARCYSAWNMYRRFNESSAQQMYEQFIQHTNPPIKAAISELLFTKNYPSFKQAVADDIDRYWSGCPDVEPSFVRRGIYVEQIAHYLRYFRLENFLFLEQSELNSPLSILQKIALFLNVDIPLQQTDMPISSNVGDYLDNNAETQETLQLLRRFYQPHNEALFAQIGLRYDWNLGVTL